MRTAINAVPCCLLCRLGDRVGVSLPAGSPGSFGAGGSWFEGVCEKVDLRCDPEWVPRGCQDSYEHLRGVVLPAAPPLARATHCLRASSSLRLAL